MCVGCSDDFLNQRRVQRRASTSDSSQDRQVLITDTGADDEQLVEQTIENATLQ